MLEFLIESGCRIGEVCGLKWGDLDFEEHHVMIERQFVRGLVRPHTKNHKFRQLPISPELVVRLRHHRTKLDRAAVEAGRKPPEWVFVSSRGNTLGAGGYRDRVWKRLVRRAGVPDYGLHGFRHTWATHALRRAYPQDVADHIGDTVAEVLRTYAHVIAEHRRSVVLHPLRPESEANLHPPRTLSKDDGE